MSRRKVVARPRTANAAISPQWEAALQRLVRAAKTPRPAPAWWSEDLAFFATVETRAARSQYACDGVKRFRKRDAPFFVFQLTLAGWGTFERYDEAPQRITPGMGFLAVVPSRHRYCLPDDAPGWTFGWFNVYHPYLIDRVSKQIERIGSVLRVEPRSALAGSALRLIEGALKRDFRDRFEVELAIFEFVIAYERFAHEQSSPVRGDALLAEVRAWVLANPKRDVSVDALAAEYGMSRSHFSHFFRAQTGLTPARLLTETRVQQAARMLLDGHASLKQIADACGFSNADHFNRVFRRFQHISPGAYRKVIP